MLIKLLIPHLGAIAAFMLAYGWMRHVGTNRSMTDLYLGLCGYGFGFGAIAASVLAAILVISGREPRGRWPILLVHLGLLGVVFSLGSRWLALHIA